MEMKLTASVLSVFVVLCFSSMTKSQGKSGDSNKEFPYVEVVDCIHCNDVALSLPTPILKKPLDVIPYKNRGTVSIQVFVNKEGNVEKAQAIAGHPFFRSILEKTALQAKFLPKMVQGKPEKFLATIVYRIVSEGDDKLADKPVTRLGIVNGMASYLPKPVYPKLPIDACASGQVSVQVLIGKNGRVKKAEAISGNQLFRHSAVKAAKLARFRHNVDGPPVEMKGIVVYNFPPSRGCEK